VAIARLRSVLSTTPCHCWFRLVIMVVSDQCYHLRLFFAFFLEAASSLRPVKRYSGNFSTQRGGFSPIYWLVSKMTDDEAVSYWRHWQLALQVKPRNCCCRRRNCTRSGHYQVGNRHVNCQHSSFFFPSNYFVRRLLSDVVESHLSWSGCSADRKLAACIDFHNVR